MNRCRATVGVLAALGLTLGLAGCGAGQGANTQKARTSIDGVNVNLGGQALQIRNVYVTPAGALTSTTAASQVPKGGNVIVYMHLYNNTDQSDALVGVAAPEGGQVGFNGGLGVALTIPARGSVTVGPSACPAGLTGCPGTTRPTSITISDLGAAHFVGTYVTLTLSFANAGSVTIDAPIEPIESAYNAAA